MNVILKFIDLYTEFDKTDFLPIEPCYPIAVAYTLYTRVPDPELLHVLMFIAIQSLHDTAPITFDKYHKVMGVRITFDEFMDTYAKLNFYVPVSKSQAYETALPIVQHAMLQSLSPRSDSSDSFEDALE